MLRQLSRLVVALLLCASVPVAAREYAAPKNFFHEAGSVFDVSDPVGDDKGPGYYTYPLDTRLRRGTFDMTRFYVYEEGKVLTFVVQFRNYVLTEWPNGKGSEDQGFVANLCDIYIDMDRRPGRGYNKALPGRQIDFADQMGWEKVILVSPLSQWKVYEELKDKTDDLSFQDMLDDVIIPDYIQVQRDRLVIRINKEFLGRPVSREWGYQVFSMGFSHVVGTNQMFNRDVRGFATQNDFGGGWDTLGDPPIIDCLVPEGMDQYELLKKYRSEPYADDIVRAQLPFLYNQPVTAPSARTSESAAPVTAAPAPTAPVLLALPPTTSVPAERLPPKPPVPAPAPRVSKPSVSVVPTDDPLMNDPEFAAVSKKPVATKKPTVSTRKTNTSPVSITGTIAGDPQQATGFMPLKKTQTKKTVTGGKPSDSADADSGFVPMKKVPVSR